MIDPNKPIHDAETELDEDDEIWLIYIWTWTISELTDFSSPSGCLAPLEFPPVVRSLSQ